MDPSLFTSTLTDINIILASALDLQLLPSAIDVLDTLLKGCPQSDAGFWKLFQQETFSFLLSVLSKTPHAVAGGAGLSSLLNLWATMIERDSLTNIYNIGILKLLELAHSSIETPKESLVVMAKCVGTAFKSSWLDNLVPKLLENIQNDGDESLRMFSLLCIGELGLEM